MERENLQASEEMLKNESGELRLTDLMKDGLPKGMEIPPSLLPNPVVDTRPAPLSLGKTNYMQKIFKAFEWMPFQVLVEKLEVLEQNGQPPLVSLEICLLPKIKEE